MKTTALALLATLAGFATTTARADHSRVNVGIGINVGSAYGGPAYAPPPVMLPPTATVIVPPAPRYTPSRGHWEDVTVKTWIPGRWVASRVRWGRPVRYFEEGRYAFRTERVWVDHAPRPAYGYNRGGVWNR